MLTVLTKINTALLLLLCMPLLISCGFFDDLFDRNQEVEIAAERIIFVDYAVESITNVNGELDIESHFPQEGIDVLYRLQVMDKAGMPIEGISVVYYQENGKSVIFVKDNLDRYNSAFLYGTPQELFDVFPINAMESNNTSEEDATTSIFNVVLTLSLIPLEEAELATMEDAYYIQQYYLTDSALEGDDYLIYCKAIDEIPDIIKKQTNLGFHSTSILISIVSPDYRELIEISSDKVLDESFNFGDKLLSQASDQWGLRTDDLAGDLIGLKSYFQSNISQFVKLQTLFEYYEIELENIRCQKYIVDVPEEVNNFLNMDFIEILEGKGLEINNGLTPANVTGNYFVDNWTNLESGTRYVNYSFQFINQTSEYKIEVRSAAEFSDASAIIAYISGEGPSFSIYSEQDHNINDSGHTVFIKTADIYSGELTQNGILNFQNGFIILEKENDLYDRFLNVGDSRVVYEADFMADAVGAFPYNSSDLDPDQSFRRGITETN